MEMGGGIFLTAQCKNHLMFARATVRFENKSA
jgi:hypothetical protein